MKFNKRHDVLEFPSLLLKAPQELRLAVSIVAFHPAAGPGAVLAVRAQAKPIEIVFLESLEDWFGANIEYAGAEFRRLAGFTQAVDDVKCFPFLKCHDRLRLVPRW